MMIYDIIFISSSSDAVKGMPFGVVRIFGTDACFHYNKSCSSFRFSLGSEKEKIGSCSSFWNLLNTIQRWIISRTECILVYILHRAMSS